MRTVSQAAARVVKQATEAHYIRLHYLSLRPVSRLPLCAEI